MADSTRLRDTRPGSDSDSNRRPRATRCDRCGMPLPPSSLCLVCQAQGATPEGGGQGSGEDSLILELGRVTGGEDSLPKIGDRIGGYVIVSEIGRGGMGAVFRARHATGGEEHALKVLALDRFGEEEALEVLARFQREASLLASVERHPGIVAVYDAGFDQHLPWYSMEIIDGEDIRERLRAGPLPVAEAASIASAIARAIQHLHEHGVLHRDLKPDNVILDASGCPRLVDFGLAIDTGGTKITESGDTVGTPAYMAPELVSFLLTRGERSEPSVATDVYGLGAFLFTLLTACSPFDGETLREMLTAITELDPMPPSQINPEVPAKLEAICLKALAKDPKLRYVSAKAMAEDIEAFAFGDQVVAARPEGKLERAARRLRFRKRNVRRNATLLAAAAAVVLLLGWTVLYRHAPDDATVAARLESLTATLERERRPSPETVRLAEELAADLQPLDPADRGRRRATQLALVARLAADDPNASADALADELAAAVRPDGGLDRAGLAEIQHLLLIAERPRALDRVLHRAEPVAIASRDAAIALARAIAAGAVAPPEDRAAFKTIYLAPDIDEATRGRVLIAHAEARLATTAGGAADLDIVLAELVDAAVSHGVHADAQRWPRARVARAGRAVLDALEGDLARAARILVFVARAEEEPDPPSVAVVATLHAHIDDGLTADRAAGRDRALLAASYLEVHGLSPVGPEVQRAGFSIDVEGIRARANVELGREAIARDPALLVVLARLHRVARPDNPIVETWLEAAVEAGGRRRWLAPALAFAGGSHDLVAETIARAAAEDRPRPVAERWPAIAEAHARLLLETAAGEEDPTESLRDAAQAALDAADVQDAMRAADAALRARGGAAPWPRDRAGGVVALLTAVAGAVIDRFERDAGNESGGGDCCAAAGELGIPTAEELLERALGVADFGRVGPSWVRADVHAMRSRHARGHGRNVEAAAERRARAKALAPRGRATDGLDELLEAARDWRRAAELVLSTGDAERAVADLDLAVNALDELFEAESTEADPEARPRFEAAEILRYRAVVLERLDRLVESERSFSLAIEQLVEARGLTGRREEERLDRLARLLEARATVNLRADRWSRALDDETESIEVLDRLPAANVASRTRARYERLADAHGRRESLLRSLSKVADADLARANAARFHAAASDPELALGPALPPEPAPAASLDEALDAPDHQWGAALFEALRARDDARTIAFALTPTECSALTGNARDALDRAKQIAAGLRADAKALLTGPGGALIARGRFVDFRHGPPATTDDGLARETRGVWDGKLVFEVDGRRYGIDVTNVLEVDGRWKLVKLLKD